MQCKNAFTMVELIFAIVILGILSAIAIPRLAATKDDALDAKDCKNTAVCITDLLSEYTAQNTATKANSVACVRAETSTKNNISLTVTNESVTVNGAPDLCAHLNTTSYFGGTRVSI